MTQLSASRCILALFARWLPLLVFAAGSASAQGLLDPSPIMLRRDSVFSALHRAGVDTICFYNSGCTGCRVFKQTPCEAQGRTEPAYVLWRQHGRTYRLYLGECQLQPAVLVTSDLWTYFDRHHRALRTETIRPFYISALPLPKRVYRNHGGWDEYQIFLPTDTIHQSINSFYLTKYVEHLTVRRRARNINYRHNRRSPVSQFLQLLVAATQAPPLRQD